MPVPGGIGNVGGIGGVGGITIPPTAGAKFWVWDDDLLQVVRRGMIKNTSGQKVGSQMVTAADGTAFTGAVTIYVTGDAGTQAIGSVGGGACTHEGNGFHTYEPATAETNYDHIAYTFIGSGAVPRTVQVYTVAGDAFTRIGAAGASLTAVPWNAAWDTEVQSEVDDALIVHRLDELLNADSDIDGAAPPTVGSVFHELMTKTAGSFTFDQATDSLEAVRDNMGTAQTGDSFARLGAPAGASVSADVAAIKAETVTILADTDNLQTRIPAALVGGRIDASVGAMATGVVTAAAVADGAIDRATFAADTGLQSLRSGTAQAGAAGTLTLDASASAVDDFYNDAMVYLTGGTGVGQVRFVTDYVGSTKVATVKPNWATTPDATSTFAVLPVASVWDQVTADHLDAGTTGNSLNAASSAGDPWSTALPGAYGAGTAGKIVGDNLNATVGSRATQTSVDTVDDFLDTEIAAIKAKTDQLVFSTANRVDAQVFGLEAAVITATAIAADAITDAKVAADVTIASVTGAVGSVTGNVGGNVVGTVGGFTTGAKAEIQTEAEDALVVHRLDELLNADSDIDGAAPPTVGSVFHELMTKTTGSFTFDQTTDSLEAVRDNMGTAQTGDSFARLGAPAGASVSADIAAVKAETATILSDTNDIQTRLPAALVSGRMDASVGAMAANVLTATAIAADAITAAKVADGTIDAATFAAGAINAAAIAADAITDAKVAADVTIAAVTGAVGSVTGNVGGNVVGTIGGFTTGAKAEIEAEVNDALVVHRLDELVNADSDIDGLAPPVVGSVFHELMSKTAGSFTFDQTTDSLEAVRDNQGTPQTGDSFARLGAPAGASVSADVAAVKAETASIQADTNDLQTRVPAALVGGRIDASVGAMAANVLTATAIAADAITDAKVAADVTIASVTGAVGSVTAAVTVGTNNDKTGYAIGTGGIGATAFTTGAIDNAAVAANTIGASELGQDAAQEIADEVLNRDIAGGASGGARNVRSALRRMRNRVAVSGGTATVYQENDTTSAWTATVTTTAGNPVSEVDPA